MKILRSLLSVTALLTCTLALAADAPIEVAHLEQKEVAVASIEGNRAAMTALSDEIWRYAETALNETRSAKALADWAEVQGFRVTRGVANIPTAFVAEYGEGSPVIGIMGEYDALPGISQKAQPTKEPLEVGAGGHGCGHNLFGVASLGAAVAIKDLIAEGRISGTIRFFGTPAEEAVGGKIYMQRDGVMDGLDVMLAWHPSTETGSDMKSSQAMVDVMVEFRGRTAHAAYDPWNGRSAADGAEIFTYSVNMMREHIRPTSRIHYTILEAGDVPNVVPESAKVWIWLRDAERAEVDNMLQRVRQIAEGAALAAGVESTLTVQAGDWNMLVNPPGQKILYDALTWLGPIEFTEAEQEFAKTIQKENGVEPKGLITQIKPLLEKPGLPEGGSTDVADISWNTPTINLSVTTAPIGAPWHGWSVVACGGMSIGHTGMIYAAKAMAATMIDLYEDPKHVEAIREDFAENTRDVEYAPYIPDGPPVPPPQH
jgi:aminobenzoyl-glutamate utilization protein B